MFRAAAWRQSPRGTYESTPPSPRCFEKAAKAEQALAANPVRQKYVPPGMRNNPGGSSVASATLNSLRDTGSTVVGRVQPTAAANKSPAKQHQPSRNLIPGEVDEEEPAPAVSAAKMEKNRRKNEKKKEKELELKRQQEEAERRERELAAKYDNDDPADIEKRLKKLRKKMRQLDQLKLKDPATLLPEQRAKLQEESKLFRLVAELEQQLAAL